MGDRQAKNALYDALAEAAKALASGRRAEIVDVLVQGERSVEELAAEVGQSVANTSQHLQRLLRAGIVRTRRDGTRVHYSLAGDGVTRLWTAMREVAEAHVDDLSELATAYLGDRSRLETITREQLHSRLVAGDVVVLDVRPEAEYAAGHIGGALSVPMRDLMARLGDLPEAAMVVAYCRGPYCVFADDAVRVLATRGRKAARLEDGLPEWRAAGLPVESLPPAGRH